MLKMRLFEMQTKRMAILGIFQEISTFHLYRTS